MTFDPATFLNTSFSDANDTKMIPIPAGDWLALAEKVDIIPWAKKDGSASGLKLQVIWEVQDEAVKVTDRLESITIRMAQVRDKVNALHYRLNGPVPENSKAESDKLAGNILPNLLTDQEELLAQILSKLESLV